MKPGSQLHEVYLFMRDGQFRTLSEISAGLGGISAASVSARLRDLRKRKYGWHTVNRYFNHTKGDNEYQVVEYVAPTQSA